MGRRESFGIIMRGLYWTEARIFKARIHKALPSVGQIPRLAQCNTYDSDPLHHISIPQRKSSRVLAAWWILRIHGSRILWKGENTNGSFNRNYSSIIMREIPWMPQIYICAVSCRIARFHDILTCEINRSRFSHSQPSNWSPKCLEYLQSVYLSVNIAALNSQEIDKYAAMSKHQEGERSAPQVIKPGPCQRFNLFPLIAADGDVKFVQPESAMSDDEHHMMETLIR